MDSLGSWSAEGEEKADCLSSALYLVLGQGVSKAVWWCHSSVCLWMGMKKVLLFNSGGVGVYAFLEALSVFSLAAFLKETENHHK